MKNINQLKDNKKLLDLREWWKQINQKDVEHIMNKKDKWNYWWFSEDKKRITTLRGWKVDNYKANETEILFIEKTEKIDNIDQETKSEILMDLLLSPDNQVKCTADAYEKARFSNKTTFWFITKWQKKAVVVMDFSQWKKTKVTKYPLDKYRLKMKPVKV
jgi:hypothetical protein